MRYIILILLVLTFAGFVPGQKQKPPKPAEQVFYYANREYGKTPTEVWLIVASGCWNVTKVVMVQGNQTSTSDRPCLYRPRYTRPEPKN